MKDPRCSSSQPTIHHSYNWWIIESLRTWCLPKNSFPRSTVHHKDSYDEWIRNFPAPTNEKTAAASPSRSLNNFGTHYMASSHSYHGIDRCTSLSKKVHASFILLKSCSSQNFRQQSCSSQGSRQLHPLKKLLKSRFYPVYPPETQKKLDSHVRQRPNAASPGTVW